MSVAFLYAGQGTQHPGMGADLYEAYPAFRAVLDYVASERFRLDLSQTGEYDLSQPGREFRL